MDLDETWQVRLRPEKTALHVSSEIALRVSERARKNGSQRRCFLSRVRRTISATFLGSISAKLSRTRLQVASRDTWFHIPEKFPLRDRICRKTLCRVPYLWQAYGSRETFCDTYTVSISWWISHKRWLLLRDVPFSSYPRPNVFLCRGISNGETWMPIFFQTY